MAPTRTRMALGAFAGVGGYPVVIGGTAKRGSGAHGARRGRSVSPEAAVVATIRHGCRMCGVPCFRLNSGAFALPGQPGGSGRFVRAGWRGAPDLVILLADGRTLWVECKSATGRLSPDQEEFRRLCGERNTPWQLARSWDDVEGWVRA